MQPELEQLLNEIALYGQCEFESGLIFGSSVDLTEQKNNALSTIIEHLLIIDKKLNQTKERNT